MKGVTALILAALAAATLLVYLPVLGNGFIDFDDGEYITGNPRVTGGLSASGAVWAFTTFHAGNWHPLTWLSHQADVQLFGLDPRWHHLTNLVLHAASALLLFLLLIDMTGARWPSAFTAALFALHPLHVESVAWASERKDVLLGLCFVLTLLGYVRYARKPGPARYMAVLGLFALALMAKPMAMTLPLVLLLLDWWPLGRWGQVAWAGASPGRAARESAGRRHGSSEWPRLLTEKVPLLAMAAASAAVTVAAQRAGGAVSRLEDIPAGTRLTNALISWVAYLGMTLRPAGLAGFYPYPPGPPSIWRAAAALVLLLGLTWTAVRLRRRAPVLVVGWLWYLLSLLPVIGLVQVGLQARADRYTYLPLIGIFAAAAWGLPLIVHRRRLPRAALAVVAVAVVAVCGFLTRVQAGYWRDSHTFFERAARATRDNWWGHENLGDWLAVHGRREEALREFGETIRIRPDYAGGHYNLAVTLEELGRDEEAADQYRRAVALEPGNADARNNLGSLLLRQSRAAEAAAQLREAVRLAPGDPRPVYNLGLALAALGDQAGAAIAFRRALGLRPDHAGAREALASLNRRQPAEGGK